MPLVKMRDLLKDAQKNNYAVPAFNVCNLEYLQCVFKAAEEMKAPVIIAIHPLEYNYAGIEEITSLVEIMAKKSDVPVVMHLDHGEKIEYVIECIQNGFNSVMFDGSKQSYEENTKITKEIVKVAHSVGIDVEAELGLVGGAEGDDYAHLDGLSVDQLTDPKQAKEFVDKTDVDSLAVAIGTAHGLYKGEPEIDLDRLKKINDIVDIPLVLHGGSGTPDKVLKKCISLGICKVNIASEFKNAFHQGMMKRAKNNPDIYEPRDILAAGKEEAIKLLKNKLKLFNAAGMAK